MKIGIVGLGLIGGSLARAYKRAGAEVLGYNRNKTTYGFAEMAGAVDGKLDDDTIADCDVIFICLTIDAAVEWLKAKADRFSKDTVVIDCCGIKRRICEAGFAEADSHGFTFIGGHPMAGKQYGGFKNSREDLFDGATMVLVTERRDDIEFLARLKDLFRMAGFGKLSFMTAEQHDDMIAFTSQMTHIAANAFVKDEADYPEGFPVGGSFRDFTRVAELDETMWTDLILENKDNLLRILRSYIDELGKYSEAIENENENELKELFRAGSRSKKEADLKDPVLTMKL
ncbi:MAG: prephenate dehydrogenase [Eubacterium sp.]|nr:prephenate dehydrogenase [Eubacterium sp.]